MDSVIGHIHAASMALYAEDASYTDKPWERWECRSDSHEAWKSVFGPNIFWTPKYEYRRKPKCLNINGHQVPEPMRVAPEEGARYWVVNLFYSRTELIWSAGSKPIAWLASGLCHLTKEAADLHATALLSFTKGAP